ncbi:MAG: 50S ribosomal protein L10 [Candidatus Buchananbacteria bacterium RIFCSPHIGHO2_02_FULL_56_16]|uniref:Large ribosomal subunit protein uL10 n=1 Tax=Candidatus Buchananbacteria bacterium RIFCSPHIGHO2_02_FULL_56_16 TaxID=1797542 RepID=A0A1G1YCE2_9BACT|nr:MAG: 50S ribosomal protein L10 [Candidatus Buchananbacteria bacterium RIFCSPHIGHO2_02_FULL_56_16]
MAKTKQQKEQAVDAYVEKLKAAKGLVFVNFEGLSVKEIEALRKQCRAQHVDYLVTKKTLMKRAFTAAGFEAIVPQPLPGGIASVFGTEDEVAPARVVGEFAKTHQALRPIGGILENKFIDSSTVLMLSRLPSKQELLAKFVGSCQAPIAGFVNVLAGNLRGLVGVLNAIKTVKS